MTEDIIDAITTELKSKYRDCKVYTEKVPQNFAEPCFFIRQLDSDYSQVGLSAKKEQNFLFTVRYFPEAKDEALEECHGVGNRLMQLLEMVSIRNQLIRSSGIRYNVQDKVLHFFIGFDIRFYIEKDISPVMGDLVVEGSVK